MVGKAVGSTDDGDAQLPIRKIDTQSVGIPRKLDRMLKERDADGGVVKGLKGGNISPLVPCSLSPVPYRRHSQAAT